MKEEDIQSIREFNRFYTNVIGLIDQHLLDSPYSLPEARVLYELYHHQPCTSSDITTILQIDKGYLSRILAQFSKNKLIVKKQSKEDARASQLLLTAKGEAEFKKINLSSIRQIKDMVNDLTATNRSQLLTHMKGIQKILSTEVK